MGKSDALWGPPQPHGSFGVGVGGVLGAVQRICRGIPYPVMPACEAPRLVPICSPMTLCPSFSLSSEKTRRFSCDFLRPPPWESTPIHHPPPLCDPPPPPPQVPPITYLGNQLGSPTKSPSPLATAKLPRFISVLCTHAMFFPAWCQRGVTPCVTLWGHLGVTPSSPTLTFPQIHRLEDVGGGDAVTLSCLQELGDLLHLLEGHGGCLDFGHRCLAPRIEAVDEAAQDLVASAVTKTGSWWHHDEPNIE